METAPALAVTPPDGVRDDMLLRMWLHGRSANTVAAYRGDAERFLGFCSKPLSQVALADLQAWADSMGALAEATRARRLAAAKSLIAFAHKLGYLPFDAGRALRVAKPTSTAAERYLAKADIARMIAAEADPRRQAVLRLLYVCGLRASEACALRWRDMTPPAKRGGSGEAPILGKGAKLRAVELPAALWGELAALTAVPKPDTPVVAGRDGEDLNRKAVHRIVKRAARRVGLEAAVSAHWIRHSHASHALDNGCKPHVLQKSLGHASLSTTTGYSHVQKGEGSASFIR